MNGLETGNESSSWRVCSSIVRWGSRTDERCWSHLSSLPQNWAWVSWHSLGDSTTSVPMDPTHLKSCHCCLQPSLGTVHYILFLTSGQSLEQQCSRSVTWALLAGKPRAIFFLGGIFLVTQVQTPGTRFRVMEVCQPSQSEILLKLCRGWGCWYRFYIRLVYPNYFHLFSCVLFSCVCVCMGDREGKNWKTLPGTFGYHCREGPVSDLIFRGRWHSTVNPCRNFKKQIVDDRVWFMRPGSPTSQVTLQYEEVCASALLRSFKYRDISR